MTVKTLSEAEKHQRLQEAMASFDVAMLVTRAANGALRARPLSVAKHPSDSERLYFSTALDSPKASELQADPRVNVCMQEKLRFVSVSGEARVVRDRALIDTLWSESWRIWFPGGKDDPSLAIVIVEPTEASYWDSKGIAGVSYLFAMAKAYVTGTKADSDADERHVAHVKLPSKGGAER